MGLGTTFANDLLNLILEGAGIANIADNASASPNSITILFLFTANVFLGTQSYAIGIQS